MVDVPASTGAGSGLSKIELSESAREIDRSTVALGLAIDRSDPDAPRVLLSQRWHPERPEIHLKWQFVGGGVEEGEDPWQALVREFQEEIACTPRRLPIDPIQIQHTWDDDNSTRHQPHEIDLIVYAVEIGDQIPDASAEEETAAVQWFTITEITEDIVLPKTLPIVKHFYEALLL
jgi:8-oxo-dGTP pyrophosphatase MutT (NUDIX family)